MTKLHYVGFNGYQHCPTNKSQLLRVVADWICIRDSKILNISCSHRIVAVETPETFELFGVLGVDSAETFRTIKKPARVNCFAVCEDFLIVASETNLWSFQNQHWNKLTFSFVDKAEQKVWQETGNEIIKLSIVNNRVILLLKNGSVWKMSDSTTLSMLYPYDLDKAVDITSGLEHTIILTESGCVLSFGVGSRGQLGNGDLNSTNQPVQISALEGLHVIKIAAGGWHSCAVTDSGDLCTWGWNNFGQLSAFDEGEEISLTSTPIFVEVGEDPEAKVVDVGCGSRHTIVKLGD